MVCMETGVLPGSQYFFFTPSDLLSRYYYYMLVCGHFYCRSGYKIQRSGNVAPLLLYMVSGRLCVEYENRHSAGSKGEVILIDCNIPHAYYCESSCEFLFFHFDGCNSRQITQDLIAQNEGPVFSLDNGRQIFEIMNSIVMSLYHEQYPTDFERSCAVYNSLCCVQSLNEVMSAASSPIPRVVSFIKNNIDKEFTLHMLSDYVHLSKYYFSHLFKEAIGLAPMEYIAQTKINLAKTILKTTQRTVSDIAVSLGYSSSSSFINAFSSRVGMPPNKFRSTPF